MEAKKFSPSSASNVSKSPKKSKNSTSKPRNHVVKRKKKSEKSSWNSFDNDDENDRDQNESDEVAPKQSNLSKSKVFADDDANDKSKESVYSIIANYVADYTTDDMIQNTSIDEVERSIATIASAQAAWKSMDGATHQLKSTLKSRYDCNSNSFIYQLDFDPYFSLQHSSTSLASRYKKFIAKKSKNTKEAAKLSEYIDLVERGLQGTEILQPIIREANNARRRQRFLQEAGLQEIDRFIVFTDKKSDLKDYSHLAVQITVLVPLTSNTDLNVNSDNIQLSRFHPSEIIIAITDDPTQSESKTLEALLHLATEELPQSISISVPASKSAKSSEKKSSQRSDISAENACEISILPSFMNLAQQIVEKLNNRLHNQQSITAQYNVSRNDSDVSSEKEVPMSISVPRFQQIRLLGHSAGGSIAAYVSMLLDGFLNIEDFNKKLTISTSNEYRGKVRCMTYGSMPCISRSVIPAFITSLICGDDLLCRIQRESLQRMREKVASAVASGAGKRGLGWLSGASLLGELSHTASKQLGQYSTRKKDTKGILHLPGRVFYMKSRQLKQGATLQRVLRGNWQEEVMWNIRDVVLSPKMVTHHDLEAYIRTLSRC